MLNQDSQTPHSRRGAIVAASVSIVAAAVACAAAVWLDTANYRASLSKMASFAAPIEQQMNDISSDLQKFSSCSDTATDESTNYSPAKRACLIKAMNASKTAQGAYAFSTTSLTYLAEHPKDEEFRNAAIGSINRGREELIRMKPLSDTLSDVSRFRNESFFIRSIYGHSEYFDSFIWWSDHLNQAEFSVMLPNMSLKQDAWMLNAQTINSRPQ